MSTLPEVHRPACATCGNPMDEHWRGRPCLTESEEPMIDIEKQRAECARMQAVCDAATEGPWHEVGNFVRSVGDNDIAEILHDWRLNPTEPHAEREADAAFVAVARTDWPALIAAHREACDEIDERQASFDLRWKADMRAIKAWQTAHPGKERMWPDHADLCVWLMDEIERMRESEGELLSLASDAGIYDGEDADSAAACVRVTIDGYSKLTWRIARLCNLGSAKPDDVFAGIEAMKAENERLRRDVLRENSIGETHRQERERLRVAGKMIAVHVRLLHRVMVRNEQEERPIDEACRVFEEGE